MVAMALLALLLLYPLLIAQVTVLLQRLPSYVLGVGQAMRDALVALSERVPDVFDQRLQDLAVGQAGAIISWIGTSLARLIGGGVALFNVLHPGHRDAGGRLLPAARLAADAAADGCLAAAALGGDAAAAGAGHRPAALGLAARPGAVLRCCSRVYYAAALSAIGLDLGLIVGLVSGILSFIPYVGTITGDDHRASAWRWRSSAPGTGVLVVLAIFVIGPGAGGLCHLSALARRPGGAARGLGDLRAVRRRRAFGFLGVLLAVPIAAALGVLARYWLRRYLDSPLYLDPPRTGPDACTAPPGSLPCRSRTAAATTLGDLLAGIEQRGGAGLAAAARTPGRSGGWRCGARRAPARPICCAAWRAERGWPAIDGLALRGLPEPCRPAPARRSTTPTARRTSRRCCTC